MNKSLWIAASTFDGPFDGCPMPSVLCLWKLMPFLRRCLLVVFADFLLEAIEVAADGGVVTKM